MRRYLVSLSVSLMLFASCGGNQSGVSGEADADSVAVDSTAVDSLAETVLPKAADELFDDFIFNFAANKRLQMSRIDFPLTIVDGAQKEMLAKNQWKMEYFFMRQGYYTLLFDSEQHMEVVKDTSVCQAVVEKIYFERQQVKQYLFSRRGGLWRLTEIRKIPVNQSHNATFLTFYHQFATDMGYQTAHLNSTVHFVGPDPDDDFSQMEGMITPDTWEAFAPELPSKVIYNIIYGTPMKEGNQKVFVMRGIANGLELEMTFRKKGGDWKLTKLTT